MQIVSTVPLRKFTAFLFTILAFCLVQCKEDKGGFEGQLFSRIEPEASGVDFNNQIKETAEEHIYTFNYIYNGAGVGIGDFNNDGLNDLYFVGNQVKDRLYLNLGDMKFKDISNESGIAAFDGWKSGVSIVDINGDGFLDIYVTRGGFKNDPARNTNLLLINKGNLTFEEQAAKYGIADPGYSIAATFFDYDNDNDLDLYVTNRPERWGVTEMDIVRVKARQTDTIDPLTTSKFYRNNGNQTFTDVTREAGLYPCYSYGLSATAGDINHDFTQDLYVANDFIENDYFYINFGNGTFKEMSKTLTNHVPYYSMGADFGDINNDGNEEIFVVEMRPDDYKRSKTTMPPMDPSYFVKLDSLGFHDQYMHNVLQYNHGNGFFTDISQMAGLEKTDWSWAALISDLDNDGWKDIFVSNGFRRDVYDRDTNIRLKKKMKEQGGKIVVEDIEKALGELPSVKLVNYVFRNNRNLTFEKKMKDWGFNETSFSNGAAIGDLDNDGDLDLVVNNIDDPAFIYENQVDQSENYLRIRLKGPAANPFGIGAKVKLTYKGGSQYQQFKTSRGYLSACEPLVHFGLGAVDQIDRIEVIWTDRKTTVLEQVKPNQLIEISYNENAEMARQKVKPVPVFTEATANFIKPLHYHIENAFDDYAVQILLPHSLSRLGPFIAVGDVNGDRKEDYYVGGSHIQAGQLYMQNDSGFFRSVAVPAFEKDRDYEDMDCRFFDADKDGDLDLYVVSGGTELPNGSPIYQDRLYRNDGTGRFSKSLSDLPQIRSSGSCVVVEDFDGDGDLDIFRGGRVIPNKYPFPPRSYLLENLGDGSFKDVTEVKAKELMQLGMVTSAIFSDLNGDQKPDLVVVGEWMPLTVLENNGTSFVKTDPAKYGFANTEGWWNRIIKADVDQDGDPDLICGNLGTNYKFHANEKKPFNVFCNDFDQNGVYDIVLAKYDGTNLVPVRGKQCSGEQVPSINLKFPTYNAFADAKLSDIYGEAGLEKSLKYEAKMFESALFLNNGGRFERILLPNEAQFSTVQAILCEDFDRDGKPEIVIAGNLFNAEIETTRADASVGLMMRFDAATKTFETKSVEQSGVFMPWDVKDVKRIELQGRPCLLVGSNNMATFFFYNNR